MRGFHWLVPILGGLLLLATDRDVSAQSTPEGYVRLQGASHTPTAVFSPTVRQSGWVPPPIAPSAGAGLAPQNAPGFGRLSTNPPGASALPEKFQAWPSISPFDHQFSEHFIDRDGLWKWRGYNNRDRRYFLGVEYIQTSFKEPKRRRIGAPGIDDASLTPNDTRAAFVGESLPGIRARWGFFDPQDQGFEMVAWWTQDLDQVRTIQTMSPNATNPSLPVLDGTMGGTIIPFDLGTQYVWRQEAYGGNFSWIFSPVVRRGSFLVQPTLGARILRLREFFSLLGSDSGAANGTPFTGLIQSDVRSLLAGPEAGIRYQVGGDHLKILGSTKFGLAANHEIVKLSGNGIGNPPNLFNQGQNFASRLEHTHISPMLAQTIFADANIFRAIPVLNHMRIFKNAHFRVGYTFQIFWEVTRPADSIVYRGQPLSPKIRSDRTSIWIGNWSTSVDWTF